MASGQWSMVNMTRRFWPPRQPVGDPCGQAGLIGLHLLTIDH